jgi:hypothetical protein
MAPGMGAFVVFHVWQNTCFSDTLGAHARFHRTREAVIRLPMVSVLECAA